MMRTTASMESIGSYLCDCRIDADERVGLLSLDVPPQLSQVFVLNLANHAMLAAKNIIPWNTRIN